MAALNITIDDTSPLIQYEPADAWAHPSGEDAQSYANSTCSSTVVEGATAKFSFSGTGFWLFGSKRTDYGQYILMLDDAVTDYANATAEETEFGQMLGGSRGLTDGQHTVVLMSAGGGVLDLDAIMLETTDQQEIAAFGKDSLPTPSAFTASVPVVSADPVISRDPLVSSISAKPISTRIAATPNAVAPGTTTIGASSSGQPRAKANASAKSASDAQSTTLTASPTPSISASASKTDVVRTTSNIAIPTESQGQRQSSSANGSTSPSGKLPMSAILGIVAGCVLVLLLIIGLLLLFLRRRRAREARWRNTALPSPTLPMQNPKDSQYFFTGQGNGNTVREKYLTLGPPPMRQKSTSTSGSRATSGAYGATANGGFAPTSLGASSMSSYSAHSGRVSVQSAGSRYSSGQTTPPLNRESAGDGIPMPAAFLRNSGYSTDSSGTTGEGDITADYSNVALTPRAGSRPSELGMAM